MTSMRHDTADELRILHWNIHSWQDDDGASNLDAVADLMQRTDPDVVSLVEVDESWGDPSPLDELARRSGYASVFVPTFEFGHDAPAGGFGNALLTRLPLLAVRQRQLLWPPRLYDRSEPSESRVVVLAKLQTEHGPVWVGSTHLPRNEADARADAFRRLAEIVQSLMDPWLLVGDFNMPAASWLGHHPSLRAYPSTVTATYHTKEPAEAIDYCVAVKDLSVQAEVLPEVGSDHLPVIVRYRVE